MRLLFVFVFLLGLVSCGEEKKSSSESSNSESFEQPDCKEINGVEEIDDWGKIKHKYKGYTGVIKKCYENGKVEGLYNVKNGKQNGLIKYWHKNGQIGTITYAKDGLPNGLCRSWHENGQLHSEFNFKDGKVDGSVTGWHENGQLQEESNYKDGILISKKRYDKKGNILND